MTLTLFIRYWQEAQTLCRVVSQRLADAQNQSESLEIKYSKAKRLVREYQSRYELSLCDPVVSDNMEYNSYFYSVFFFFTTRQEESENREADLMRELEERDKQHREAVERLQMQVSASQVSMDLVY